MHQSYFEEFLHGVDVIVASSLRAWIIKRKIVLHVILNLHYRYLELHSEYHGRGERTVKETADLVGFKLPNDPR